MSPWELIRSGKYERAVELYTQALRERPSTLNYINRGIAYLNLQQHDLAIADFESSELDRPANVGRSSAEAEWIGTALWCAGAEREAAERWRHLVDELQTGEIGYTDAAGGVLAGSLLWFAAVAINDAELLNTATHWLQTLDRGKGDGPWPRPLATFLLGRTNASDLLACTSQTPTLHERQACQAHFYIAIRARQMGDQPGGSTHLEYSANLLQAKLERVWYLALHELAHSRHHPR